MSTLYSKQNNTLYRFFASMIIAMLVAGMMPLQVFADETGGTDQGATTEETTATSTDTGTESTTEDSGEENTTTTDSGEETATSTETGDTQSGDSATTTDETATSTDTENATSTESGTPTTDGADGESGGANNEPGADGADGNGDTESGETATTTDETATTTDNGTDGPEGESGSAGTEGDEGVDGSEDTDAGEEDEGEPVPVVSLNEIGQASPSDDNEEITGSLVQRGRNATVVTGEATAQGEILTDVNSNLILSEADNSAFTDLDIYSFTASGTNEANISNDGAVFAMTGDNLAVASGVADIVTSNAIAAMNIANVVNTNVVNSEGFLYLKNHVLTGQQSLDLSDFFFPDEVSALAAANDCNLTSCMAEDIVYNFSQMNTATVTNDAILEAITGENDAEGDYAQIETGDAYGGANVINVVNTNIVDSNYRLLTFNAIGDLDGDLVLPTESLFKAFYGRPNGMVQTEHPEDVHISDENVNDASVQNNVVTYAETGLNESYAGFDSVIETGVGESESNILNKINENVFGGDALFLLIRVHGNWSGDVYGLPEGLAWEWTPDGIVIYNEDAEIEPSAILPYDIDSYTANLENHNNVAIENNINIDAVSGKNIVDGLVGVVETGDAFASANVMNIANTNVVGANWTYAVVNIFGDFDGNVTFEQADLAITGDVTASDNPAPGEVLSYSYTVHNNGDTTAEGVKLKQTLQHAYVSGTANQQEVAIGTLAPGASQTVTLSATIDSNLGYGTTSVIAVANVTSEESDSDSSDNTSLLSVEVVVEDTPGGTGDTGTTTDPGDTGTTTDPGDTGTTTDDGTDNGTDDGGDDGSTVSSGGSSGGGGGGGSSKKKKKKEPEVAAATITTEMERMQVAVDPKDPPHITISKTANVNNGNTIIAGKEVNYTITIVNQGGGAYDAVVYDSLTNPIGSLVTEQSWDLGTILPGEIINLEYTTAYNEQTPSGIYTNTASVEAYRLPGAKAASGTPLKLDDAVHTIEIDGVDLAVGNVGVVAYFPLATGGIGALVTWETSQPANSKIYYSPSSSFSFYAPSLPNYGFDYSSLMFPQLKAKHAMILLNLQPGTQYAYVVRAFTAEHSAVSSKYTFSVPAYVPRLTLALPTGQTTEVATAPAQTAPAAPAPQAASFSYATPKAAAPAPVATPAPKPKPDTSTGTKKVLGSVVNNVTGGVLGWLR